MKLVIRFFIFIFISLFIIINCSQHEKIEYIEKKEIIYVNVTSTTIIKENLVITPKSGIYYNDVTVDINIPYKEAIIKYTLDGTDPSLKNGINYEKPFKIGSSCVLKAIVYKDLTGDPVIYKETYDFVVAPLKIIPPSDTKIKNELTNVEITTETKDAEIYFTIDGTTPSKTNGYLYEKPFNINSFTILKAIGYKNGYKETKMVREAYSFEVASPIIETQTSTEFFTYDSVIKISCPTLDSIIYYTLDGTDPSSNSKRYSSPITLTPESGKKDITLKAIAYKYGWAYSGITSKTFKFKVEIVNMYSLPGINQISGFYDKPQKVFLMSSTIGAKIYYTTDDSTPDQNSNLYTSPITINSDTKLKAIAIKDGMYNSDYSIQLYKFKVSNPEFSFPGGIYNANFNVKLSCSTPGTSIYYTFSDNDNTPDTPDNTKTLYTTPININTPYKKIKARAYKTGYESSEIVEVSYRINTTLQKVNNPEFSIQEGTYDSPQQLTLSTQTEKAFIYWTKDGTTPSTESSNLFETQGIININSSMKIKAIAYKEGMAYSDIIEKNYIIKTGKLEPPVMEVLNKDPEDTSDIYYSSQQILLTHDEGEIPDHNFQIRYTIDGSEPSEATADIYYGQPIVISSISPSITLKVKAFKKDWEASDTITQVFNFKLPQVTLNPEDHIFKITKELYLSQSVSGASIRYTTNGSDPSETNGILYDGSPIIISNGMIVKAISYKQGWFNSDIITQNCVLQVSDPIFDLPAGTYNGEKRVVIQTKTSKSKIVYTIDDSDPKTSNTKIEVDNVVILILNKTTTIKAYAKKDGWNDSNVVINKYVIY